MEAPKLTRLSRRLVSLVVVELLVLLVLMAPQAAHADQCAVLVSKAKGLIAKKMYREAIVALDSAIKLRPEAAEAYTKRAEVYVQLEDYDRAMQDAQAALRFDPRGRVGARIRVFCYWRAGRCKDVIEESNQVLKIKPRSYWLYPWRSRCFIEMKEYDKAIDSLNKTIAVFPNAPAPLAARATCQAMAGTNRLAISDLLRAMRLAHESHGLLVSASDKVEGLSVSYGPKIYQAVLSECNRRVTDKSKDAGAHFSRAFCLYMLGNYREAIVSCDKAIALHPRLLDAYVIRGFAVFCSGDSKTAFDDIRKVIALAPDYESGYAALAGLYYGNDHYDQALTPLSQYIAQNPHTAAALCQRAQVYADLGQQEKAIKDLTGAIAESPKNAQYFLSRGEYLLGMQAPKRALDDFSRAIALDPKLSPALVDRAGCYIEQKQFKAAADDLTAAAKLSLTPSLLAARASCYEKLGRIDLARKDRDEEASFGF